MTRGKHAKQSAARTHERAVDEVVAEFAALADEQQRHAQAVAKSHEVDDANRHLAALERARDRLVAAERAGLDAELVRLERAVETVEQALERVRRSWGRHMDRLATAVAPPGVDRVEVLMSLLDLGDIHVVEHDYERKLGRAGVASVRKARREGIGGDIDDLKQEVLDKGHDPIDDRPTSTNHQAPPKLRGRHLPAWFETGRTPAGGWALGDERDEARRLCEEARASHPLSATRTAAFMWSANCDWVVEQVEEAPPHRPLPDGLGALATVDDVDLWARQQGFAEWPSGAPTPDECWARDATIAKAAARVANILSPSPRFARPGDATLLRHLYVQRATGMLVARTEIPAPDAARLDDEATWAAPADERAPVTASVRDALATAIPFWMPPGETAAFARSEPLDDESVTEIELPFPAVLVVPAEPMRLDPVEADEATAADLGRLDRALLRRKDLRVTRRMSFSPPFDDWEVPVGDALRVRGGLVEAVLVRANRAGGLADGFAWCIAIPHPNPRVGVLGRVVVPAFLSRSAHADTVRQLAAAVAWADWRTPTAVPRTPGELTADPRFADRERSGDAGGVHVLDATRTYAHATSDGAGDGPMIAPHLRRAHWRRTRIGTRADWDTHRSYRRTRIAAVVVNAGSAMPFSAQVYRLTAGTLDDRPPPG